MWKKKIQGRTGVQPVIALRAGIAAPDSETALLFLTLAIEGIVENVLEI